MALTDGLDAVRGLLSCVQADGSHVSDVLLEEKLEAKLKKLKLSGLTPGVLILATDEGRKKDKPLFACPRFLRMMESSTKIVLVMRCCFGKR